MRISPGLVASGERITCPAGWNFVGFHEETVPARRRLLIPKHEKGMGFAVGNHLKRVAVFIEALILQKPDESGLRAQTSRRHGPLLEASRIRADGRKPEAIVLPLHSALHFGCGLIFKLDEEPQGHCEMVVGDQERFRREVHLNVVRQPLRKAHGRCTTPFCQRRRPRLDTAPVPCRREEP